MYGFVCILCPSPPRSQTTFQVVPGGVLQPRTAQDGFVYPKVLEFRWQLYGLLLFYVDRRNGIYMHVDDRYCVEFGLCRTSQDTLYCYPRFYKGREDSVFVRSNISRLYAALNEKGGFDDLDELVYLQTEDKLIYIGPPGLGPASDDLVADGFVKVKIRNKWKYMYPRPIM